MNQRMVPSSFSYWLRWFLSLLGLVWLVTMERMIGIPVISFALTVLWLNAPNFNKRAQQVIGVLVLSLVTASLYQVFMVGVLFLLVVQSAFFIRLQPWLVSPTLRWWLVSWWGGIGMILLTQSWLSSWAWGYTVLITTLLLVGIKLLVWWQRARQRRLPLWSPAKHSLHSDLR